MKRNLLYLAGFLLAAVTVFSGCNDDVPSYHQLVQPPVQSGKTAADRICFLYISA